MLERGYTMPILFGVCLGIILAGVQVSAAALGAALGQHRDVALVVFENTDRRGLDVLVLGRGLSVSLPDRPAEIAGGALKRAEELYVRCRDRAESVPGKLAGLAERCRERARAFSRALAGCRPEGWPPVRR